jgi:dihydroorotase-like cyclic amidohydrolase
MKAKISPPLRDKQEQDGLWQGMLNGGIWSIGSDHVPFLPKKGADLWTELPGVVSFPWELALLVHFGVHQRGLPLTRLVELTSTHAARRFGLWPRKGNLQAGADADLVLVDLDKEQTAEHDGKGTCIYAGWKLKGWPVLTVSRGEVVYEDGQVHAAPGRGQCLSRPAA